MQNQPTRLWSQRQKIFIFKRFVCSNNIGKNGDNITNGAPEASQSESILSLSRRSASHSRG